LSSHFRHKQPTRFNAPEIPQDLATKAYVDGTTGDSFSYVACNVDNGPLDLEWIAYALGTWNATENKAVDRWPYDVDGTFEKHQHTVNANAQLGAVTINFRIELLDVNAIITIGAGLTGSFITTTQDVISENEQFGFQLHLFDGNNFDSRNYYSRGVLS